MIGIRDLRSGNRKSQRAILDVGEWRLARFGATGYASEAHSCGDRKH